MSEKSQYQVPHQELLDDVTMAYDEAEIPTAQPDTAHAGEHVAVGSFEQQVCVYMVAIAKLLQEARTDATATPESK